MTDINARIAHHLPLARSGDPEAFAELVRTTQTTVTSVALAIVRDIQASEDIAQEAYLRVWRRLGDLRNSDSFLPWLRQITRNLARDHLRRGEARPGDRTGYDPTEAIAVLIDPHPTADAQLHDAQEQAALRRAFDEIPPEAREVLTLYYREGQSVEQLSALLGISAAGIRQRLSRARKRLRSDLEAALDTTLVRSTPGAAFTAAVGSLVAGATPPPAAALPLAAMGSQSALKVTALGGLGVLLGALGGIAGVVLGMRPLLRKTHNSDERDALLRQRRRGIVIVLLAMAGFAGTSVLPGWEATVAVYGIFIAALTWHTQVALPRILAPRLDAERAADPEAHRRQVRARRAGLLGLIGGAACGFLGLLAGLAASGRLP